MGGKGALVLGSSDRLGTPPPQQKNVLWPAISSAPALAAQWPPLRQKIHTGPSNASIKVRPVVGWGMGRQVGELGQPASPHPLAG